MVFFLKNYRNFTFLVAFWTPLLACAEFTTGLGYLTQQNHRVDNEISPFPFGLNFVPMLAYQSRKWRIYGPNVSYSLLNGFFGAALHFSATGDRYQAYDVATRETAVNVGASVRILYLTLKHEIDFFHTYNGNITSLILAKPFKLSEKIVLIPGLTKKFLSKGYVNYYYGIRSDETSYFSSYKVENAVNNEWAAMLKYSMDEINSFMLSYKHIIFDRVIYDSPTVRLREYDRWGLFWNHKI